MSLVAIRVIDVEIQVRDGDLVASIRATIEAAGDGAVRSVALDMMGAPYSIEMVRIDKAWRGYQLGRHIVFERLEHVATWHGAVLEYVIRFGEQPTGESASVLSPLLLPEDLPSLVRRESHTPSSLPVLRVVVDELVAGVGAIRMPRDPWARPGGQDLVAAAVFATAQVTSSTPPLLGYKGVLPHPEDQVLAERMIQHGHRLFGMRPTAEVLVIPASAHRPRSALGAGAILDTWTHIQGEGRIQKSRTAELALALAANWCGAGFRIEGSSGEELWHGMRGGICLALLQIDPEAHELTSSVYRSLAKRRSPFWAGREKVLQRRAAKIAVAVGKVLESDEGQERFRAFLKEAWGTRLSEVVAMSSLRAMGVEI